MGAIVTAAPITGICSMATRHVLVELGREYEQRTGQPVTVTSAGGVDVMRRVQSGEPFDFVSQAADAIGRLTGDGHVVAASRVEHQRGRVQLGAVGEGQLEVSAGNARLELGRRALGDDLAAVEHRDAVRELVGLL